MRSWWRTHHPLMRMSDYGFRAAHDAAKLVEAGMWAQLVKLPEAELRLAVDRLERAERIEAARAPKPRPGPAPSPF